MSNEQADSRIALHKHYLRGKLIAAVAETVGNVNIDILAQISELVAVCEPTIREREELSERTYACTSNTSVCYSLDPIAATAD